VFVAAGDVAGDARAEIITGAGPGGGPHVRVFDQSLGIVTEFFAYHPNFGGGVRVGVMDLTGDSHLELITATGIGGGPHVRVLTVPSLTQAASFFAFDPTFSGGVFVAGSRNPPSAMLLAPSSAGSPLAGENASASRTAIVDRVWEEFEDDEAISPTPVDEDLEAFCLQCHSLAAG
jgi:hypothetical protein